MMKIPNLKLVILLEYQNKKKNFCKRLIRIGLKKFLWLKKSTTLCCEHIKREEIVGAFNEKELQKTSQKEFSTEKVMKRKDDKLCVKWKGYNSSFNCWIDNKDIV